MSCRIELWAGLRVTDRAGFALTGGISETATAVRRLLETNSEPDALDPWNTVYRRIVPARKSGLQAGLFSINLKPHIFVIIALLAAVFVTGKRIGTLQRHLR